MKEDVVRLPSTVRLRALAVKLPIMVKSPFAVRSLLMSKFPFSSGSTAISMVEPASAKNEFAAMNFWTRMVFSAPKVRSPLTSRLRRRKPWLGVLAPASPRRSRLPATESPNRSSWSPMLVPKMDSSKITLPARFASVNKRASSANRSSSPAEIKSEVLMKITFWYGWPFVGSNPSATPSNRMFPEAFSPALISINPNCPPSSTDGEPPAMRIKLPLMLMASLIVNS